MEDDGHTSNGERLKKGRGISWTNEERKLLYECYERSGGVRKGGYIQKVDEKYYSMDVMRRSTPAIIAQLKGIEKGGWTGPEKSEIKQKIQKEKEELDKIAKTYEELFGDSSSEESFEGFIDEEDEEEEEEEEEEEGEVEDIGQYTTQMQD